MNRKQSLMLACALAVAMCWLPALAQDKPDQSSQPSSSGQSSTQSAGQPQSDQAATGMDQATQARVQQRLQHISTELNLTDDQKAKIKPLLQEEVSQMNSLRSDTSLSQDQRQAKMKEIHQTYSSQIQAVLTPEQQKKWAEMKEQKKGEMQEHQQQQPK
jgi:periplasmic protein CpxP/Spy